MTEPLVVLRPLAPADAEVLASWSLDPEFRRAAEWSDCPVAQHADVHRGIALDPPRALLRYAAVHDGRVVGYVDLHGEEPLRRELGYVIGPRSAWGRGLGLAAARAGLAYGFDVLGLHEIWAEALDANEASVRILRRLGMTETGRGHDAEYLGRPTFYRRFAIPSPAAPDIGNVPPSGEQESPSTDD